MESDASSQAPSYAPMSAPWAATGAGMTPEEQQKLLHEKLARARAMKPGISTEAPPVAPQSPARVPSSPPRRAPSHDSCRSPRSPGLVVAPWAVEPPEQSLDGEEDVAACPDNTPAVVVTVGGERKEFKFRAPVKAIKTPQHLLAFQKSATYESLKGFILSLNEACKGKAFSTEIEVSARCQEVITILGTMSTWVDDIPPIEQPMRYGNKAFRDWIDRCVTEVPKLVREMLPEHLKSACVELSPYLSDSFGNKERIDYGTGHENTFVAFLAALAHIGYFEESDMEAIALRVFWEYLKVSRKLQLTYRLEPAGSHGCWSLDDYQFVPFMWGSAQLIDHPTIKPSDIHDVRIVTQGADDWYYLHCVKFIHEVKSGQLAENSPMLNDISGCPTWQRVNSGMLKMYFAEVMDKLPVVQHMLFGSIFTYK